MRKTCDFTIPDSETYARDRGKKFRITEMPASQGEEWAARALNAMATSGVEIPPEFMAGGWPVVAMLGLRAILSADFEKARPLLAEMMGCVELVTSSGAIRGLVEDDIEEVATRLLLRDEVFRLHAGFSVAGFLSNALSMVAAEPGENGSNTETSNDESESWSAKGSQPSQS